MKRALKLIAIGLSLILVSIPGSSYMPPITEGSNINQDSQKFQQRAEINKKLPVNVTALWGNVASRISEERIANYVHDISVHFPNRVWSYSSGKPSTNLQKAWEWANNTLKNATQDTLAFRFATEYDVLYAVQKGTGPAPRPIVVVSGIIDGKNSPGANEVGASVAAVLEAARAMYNESLFFDIYYVLTNSARAELDFDVGGQAFINWLLNKDEEIITAISFDRLLFQRTQFPYGTEIHLRSRMETSIYQQANWIPDLMVTFSTDFGSKNIKRIDDEHYASHSMAYEMWMHKKPAVFVSQGYYYDTASGTDMDTADYIYYSYSKVRDVVAATVGTIMLIGKLGSGAPIAHYLVGSLQTANEQSRDVVPNIQGFVNVTITWTNQTTILASIINVETSETVYERIENDGLIYLKYLALEKGRYRITVRNIGANNTDFKLNVTFLNDCDGDGLSDSEEISIGLNPYLRDTDRDGLNDDFELAIGSDPLENDSDGDGALDSDEYNWGASPVLQDTDGDNITDGVEADLGTDPTKWDSDSDGIDDYSEVFVYHSNPLDKDTDGDGLEDSFEITTGLDPLSIDTDGDSLSDLFEVLNHINPLSVDSDRDGWSDAYEIHHCMSPTNVDTDGDLIPDTWDWNPQEHWVAIVSPVLTLSVLLLLGVFALFKHRQYYKRDELQTK